MSHRLGYVLPVRLNGGGDPEPLSRYLRWLAPRVAAVFVVDGSEPEVFARNARCWPSAVRHVPPDEPRTPNGKVGGVCTGLRLAAAAGIDACIVADDDVRYGQEALDAMAAALDNADVVRPQNYFQPVPWHALIDTARSLLNRAFSADYPGTLGVRCAALPSGYAGDVLFENLELIRTVRAHGGLELVAPGLFVRRLPPTAAHFFGQRIRQAYDGFAQPARLAAELTLLPAVAATVRRPRVLAGGAAASMLIAEIGRRRAGGRAFFPAAAALCAPLWLLERAVCSWVAVGARLRGGVRYGGTRLRTAGHSLRELRRAAAASGTSGAVGAVAERLDRGTTAPAQRHRAAGAAHDGAVGLADLEVAAEQQWPVGVGGHRRRRLRSHDTSLPTGRLR